MSAKTDTTALQRPPSLASLATDRLKAAIEGAEFDLGAPLSEDKLATFFGISRTPVREALNTLSLQGLVEIFPQRGSYVFRPSEEDVSQLCEFRMMMESRAIGLCLARDKEQTLQRMIAANERMREAIKVKDRKLTAESDTAFHMALFEGCGNRYLQETYGIVSGRITALRTHLVDPQTGISPQAVKEHDLIIEAFADGNQTQAEAILSSHIYKMAKNYGHWLTNRKGLEASGDQPERRTKRRVKAKMIAS
jgi:DNA-binding GntR family transcriptional regulator